MLYHPDEREVPEETTMAATTLAVFEDHTLIDTEPELIRFLAAAAADGRLMTHPDVIRRSFTRLPDGRIAVPVTLRVPMPARSWRLHPVVREVGGALAKALTFASVVGAVMVLVVYGLWAVAEYLWSLPSVRAAVGVAAVVLILGAVLTFIKTGGHHCPGCPDH